jgi:hypothetical protein
MHMTSPRVRAVIELLGEMSDEEHEELRNELEGSTGWSRAWNQELARRLVEIESGQVQLVDGDEFLAELRRDTAR